MTAPLLQVEGLSCGHAGQALLAPLTLTLGAARSLAIVGPNGAGKTTLLCTLAGLLPPLAGRVLLEGQDLSRLGSVGRARRVALLPQRDLGEESLTVRELVELGRTPHLGLFGRRGVADEEAVERALSACQLAELAGRRLDRLSGGERQRARLALTVAQETPLLLLDEPASHLDLRRRFELFALLGRLRQERRLAVVMVLHDLAEAFREADEVLVVASGRAERIALEAPDRVARLAAAFGVPEDRIALG